VKNIDTPDFSMLVSSCCVHRAMMCQPAALFQTWRIERPMDRRSCWLAGPQPSR
jgi:hypothetical protein